MSNKEHSIIYLTTQISSFTLIQKRTFALATVLYLSEPNDACQYVFSNTFKIFQHQLSHVMTEHCVGLVTVTNWVLVRCPAGWLNDPWTRTDIGVSRFILLWCRRRLDIFWPAVADEVCYTFEHKNPNPLWNLPIFQGVMVEDVGNDDSFQ